MYSGELEVQAKRKAIAVLQDEINRILNASRELSSLPELLVKKNKTDVKAKLEQISSLEDEVENLRRKITRDVADVGGLIMNRENILNTAYTMDEIAGYITGSAFKLSNIKVKTLTTENFDKELRYYYGNYMDEYVVSNHKISSYNRDKNKRIILTKDEFNKIMKELGSNIKII